MKASFLQGSELARIPMGYNKVPTVRCRTSDTSTSDMYMHLVKVRNVMLRCRALHDHHVHGILVVGVNRRSRDPTSWHDEESNQIRIEVGAIVAPGVKVETKTAIAKFLHRALIPAVLGGKYKPSHTNCTILPTPSAVSTALLHTQ